MNFIEAAFISRNVYNSLEEQRLQSEDTTNDELYIAMFAFARSSGKKEAAKLPVEFKDVAQVASGMYLASLAVLNKDLQPTVTCVGEFYDGFWADVRKQLVIDDPGTGDRYAPVHSYVRDYDPHIDADLQLAIKGLLLTA